jgi:23S rRNA C2498 (ribose-2'-O)-methylase RlmM
MKEKETCQLTFLDYKEEEKLKDFSKRIFNLRCGLFKRYEEMKRALDFLEKEIEDFIQEKLKDQ